MALGLWNGKDDLGWLHASLDETLDAAVGAQGSAVDDAILDSLLVCEGVDEGAALSEMLIEVRVINAQDLISSEQLAWRGDASGGIAQRVQGLVLDAHSQDQGIVWNDRVVVQDDVLV